MEPRNKELLSQAKRLCDVIVSVIENHSFIESYGTLFDRVDALINGDPNLISKILELRQDIKEEILSNCLTQTQRFLKTLMKSGICEKAPHPSTEEGHKRELTRFLTKVLEVRANQTKFFSKEGLEKQYNETFFPKFYKIYENYLYSPAPKEYLFFPINNLMASRPIDLESWQIRKMSENEVDSLIDAHRKHGVPLDSYPEFIVCLNYDSNWHDNIKKIIAALRLLKREKIFLKYVYRASYFPFYTWQILSAPEGTRIAGKVAYTASDIAIEEDELKSLWKVLRNMRDTNYITTALSRFNFAYERERIEDAWVDYFISLESLFLKESGGENFELTHRLSNRISKVLGGDTFSDRKEMNKKVKAWYRIRSKIVHGASLKSKEIQQIDELNQKVSASIGWFIKNVKREEHDTILDMLDLVDKIEQEQENEIKNK